MEQQQQSDAKTQYTNLEPAVPPQTYYIADGYQPPGSYTYLPHAASKEFFHSASPNTVLYKGDDFIHFSGGAFRISQPLK